MIQVSDIKDELDRFSSVCTSEEEEEMALNRKKYLKDFLAERNKGLAFKGALGS